MKPAAALQTGFVSMPQIRYLTHPPPNCLRVTITVIQGLINVQFKAAWLLVLAGWASWSLIILITSSLFSHLVNCHRSPNTSTALWEKPIYNFLSTEKRPFRNKTLKPRWTEWKTSPWIISASFWIIKSRPFGIERKSSCTAGWDWQPCPFLAQSQPVLEQIAGANLSGRISLGIGVRNRHNGWIHDPHTLPWAGFPFSTLPFPASNGSGVMAHY